MEFINDGCNVYSVLHDGSRTLFAVAEAEALAEIIVVSLQERFDRICGKG